MPVTHSVRPDGLRSKCGRKLSPTLLIGENVECKECLLKGENYFHNYVDNKRPRIITHHDNKNGKSLCGKRLWGMIQASDIYTCLACEEIATKRELNGIQPKPLQSSNDHRAS